MSDALTYFVEKYGLHLEERAPLSIRNTNRDTFARDLHYLGLRKGAEIGVERGLYSEVLCTRNPGVDLICVDAWQPYVGYRDHVDGAKLERFYHEARARLEPYRVTFIRAWSVEAAATIPDGSLDFVYIDGNHALPHVIADLAAWTPKVRPGGIVAGHDYLRHRWPNQMHVVQAVQAWTDAYDIKPWFVLGSKDKREGELRDDGRSWFWIHTPRPVWRKRRRPIKQ